MTATVYIHS